MKNLGRYGKPCAAYNKKHSRFYKVLGSKKRRTQLEAPGMAWADK